MQYGRVTYTGTAVGSTYHIEWAEGTINGNNNKISSIKIYATNGYNTNYQDAKYFDGKTCEIEDIEYYGDIYVNDVIDIKFNVKRGKGSETGRKFVPFCYFDGSEISRIYKDESNTEINIISASELENVNSFDIHLRFKLLKPGDIAINVLADDGGNNRSIIRVTFKNVKAKESQGGNGSGDSGENKGDDIDYWKPALQTNNTKFKSLTGKIIGTIQVIGSVVSVVILVILGIKYMCASLEEKASYKQSMVLYVVGCIMVFGVVNIAKIIYDIAIGLN